MQFFGARANLGKVPALRDQRRSWMQRPREQVAPAVYARYVGEYLEYEDVMRQV